MYLKGEALLLLFLSVIVAEGTSFELKARY